MPLGGTLIQGDDNFDTEGEDRLSDLDDTNRNPA